MPGHADIVRETIDGAAGSAANPAPEAASRQAYVARIQAAADVFARPAS